MGLKVLIVIEFILLLACLSGGFVFLMKDISVPDSKRTLYILGTRIVVAALLMLTIGYGIQTGKLKNTAPWDRHKMAAPEQTN
ncbi:DUF2909 domain-containing protein [Agarilytica rhodophyticola]|uniref:DUF2909 domain-containing protein n=1 Tax=Agarilytica rhodophyticola TaxID=1737490 RepID=UPI000B34508C|nr:DUF2909 domain-containing protein [Agarilytica rhodophyticola]